MKHIKTLAILAMVFSMTFSMATGVVATNNVSEEIKITASPNVQFEREDVSISLASSDMNLPETKIREYATVSEEPLIARNITWHCEGWYGDSQYNSMGYAVHRPYGLSEHRNGNSVLDTLHYTRTYVDKTKMYGDSGRVWGTGRVIAPGTLVDVEITDLHIHYVKYGTTTS